MIEWIPGAIWQWFLVHTRRRNLEDYTADWQLFQYHYFWDVEFPSGNPASFNALKYGV
jgi:hypothetical protein